MNVAVRRRAIEEGFQVGKSLYGLDQHQVRTFKSWYRWATLAMLAHAFLAAVGAAEHAWHSAGPDLIPLPPAQAQRLMTA